MAAKRMEEVADWLDGCAAKIAELEIRARDLIERDLDQDGYKALMREKALLLAGLGDEAAERLAGESGPEAQRILRRMDKFSASAASALEIGSVFFMSALLYPEDHAPGDKNDLEAFILTIRSASARG